jgi:hypothetical protein
MNDPWPPESIVSVPWCCPQVPAKELKFVAVGVVAGVDALGVVVAGVDPPGVSEQSRTLWVGPLR